MPIYSRNIYAMKFILNLFIICFLFSFSSISSQVGVNTVDPQADLDINGDLRVREVLTDNTLTSVLVVNSDGLVKMNTTLLGVGTKSFVWATGNTSFSLLSLDLLSGFRQIPFAVEEVDDNNDYNNTTYQFTAPRAGIYDIYVQFQTSDLISVGEVGLAVLKKASGASVYTLVAQDAYLNASVGIVLIKVATSPLARKVRTLVRLATGDNITFGASVPLLTVNLLGGTRSYFFIQQVKKKYIVDIV